jgi:hypothetical protein
MSNIKLRTLNSFMNEVYDRVSKNKPFDTSLKPYKESLIKEVLCYFEDKEDYEKCQVLSDFINVRFNHIVNYLK